MKTFMIILVGFCGVILQVNYDLAQLRELYSVAVTNESSCKDLINTLDGVDKNVNPVAAGYKACGLMVMANHYINPISKLNTFNEGKDLLNACIEIDKDNTELRFLRFVLQCETPLFLGYNKDINADKALVCENFSGLKDAELKEMIRAYMVQSDVVSEEEKKIFHTN